MSASGAGPTPAWTPPLWAALAALGLFVVALTIFAASGGVRGSDQYWYVADVETLVRTHAISSNTIFPVGLLGPDSRLPPPFIHNVLSVYLAAVPALALGPVGGWVALNIAAVLGTSVLIYLAARTVANRWAAILCAALYPLLPVTVWETAQPLAEASTSFFAALTIYLVAVAGASSWRWLAVVCAAGLLYASRESYLPLLLIAPAGFLFVLAREHRMGIRPDLGPMAALTGVVLAIVAAVEFVFGAENVTRSYARLLHSAVPGRTDNMWYNFDLSDANVADHLPLDLGLLAPKLAASLAEQFVSFENPAVAAIFWTFNILAAIAIVSLWRFRDPQHRWLVLIALAPVAIHFVTIGLFQNQFRYTMPALPGLLVVFAMQVSAVPKLERLLSPRLAAALIALIVLAAGPSFLLARMAHDSGAAIAPAEAATRSLFEDRLSPGEPALIVYRKNTEMLAYAAQPRMILYVAPDYTKVEYLRLLRAFPARWILAPVDSPALTTLGVPRQAMAGDVEAFGTRWGLFRLPD